MAGVRAAAAIRCASARGVGGWSTPPWDSLPSPVESAVVWASVRPDDAARAADAAFIAAARAVEIAIQVHGGLGFTWEMGLHFYLRHVDALGELVRELHR